MGKASTSTSQAGLAGGYRAGDDLAGDGGFGDNNSLVGDFDNLTAVDDHLPAAKTFYQ